MSKNIFLNDEHEKYYYYFVKKSNCMSWDCERKSLFYLFSLLEDTRDNIDSLYDFENGYIIPDGINCAWQTGSSTALTRLAFNLYNGYVGNNSLDTRVTPLSIFTSLDVEYLEYLFNGIKIRLGKINI